MYQEMYNGIVDLLRVGHAEDIRHLSPDNYPSVAQLMDLVFNISIEGVKRIKKLDIDGISPIYLILADPSNNGQVNTNQLISYILVDGKPAWVVLFNFSMLVSRDVETEMAGLVSGIKSLCRVPIMSDRIREQFSNFDIIGTIQYYAPLFIAAKLLHRYYPSAPVESLRDACRFMYKSITDPNCESLKSETVIGVINILTEFDLSDLLDNSYFIGTSGNELYKNIWFAAETEEMDDIDADITEAELEQAFAELEEEREDANINSRAFQLCRINGVNFLYSYTPISPVPFGFYPYYIRHVDGDIDTWATVEPNMVKVNYAGMILSSTELNLSDGEGNDKYIKINTCDKTSLLLTCQEYLDQYANVPGASTDIEDTALELIQLGDHGKAVFTPLLVPANVAEEFGLHRYEVLDNPDEFWITVDAGDRFGGTLFTKNELKLGAAGAMKIIDMKTLETNISFMDFVGKSNE